MCGIAGIIAFNQNGRSFLKKISAATTCLKLRGPDDEGIFEFENVAFGHRRLSIIDTSHAGSQPMSDISGRYTIIFNGEFFNFREHKNELLKKGVSFFSESDTEVLLQLYIDEGPDCLQKINGFFSLAIYDKKENNVFIARDRFGVKPFYFYSDEDKFIFASEMKAILAFGVRKEIDQSSLITYLQLNYVPAPSTMLKNIFKQEQGTYSLISYKGKRYTENKIYYKIPVSDSASALNYDNAKNKLIELLDASVKRRLISDVPLGAFLSGGIDSSAIVALASRHIKNLNTFSIGFKNEPLFDETQYAKLVADKFKTNHTVFSLTDNDLYQHLNDILDYTDEPFADSSAIAVYILSKETRKHVTVALSGDGADELFAGYNKHRAEWLIRNNKLFTGSVKMISPLFSLLQGSRNSKTGNRVRQLKRFSDGAKMSPADRYWRWCGFAEENTAVDLIKNNSPEIFNEYIFRKNSRTDLIRGTEDMNDVLLSDVRMVLADDMLAKVDRMSMANSLEVRTPFLDFELVNFAFSFKSGFKIDKYSQKKILRESFRKILPEELFKRKKQGFEVPLLSWFKTDLKSLITDNLLNDRFIDEQGLFNVDAIKELKARLYSGQPGESVARIWGLLVFQYWYKKYFTEFEKV